MHRPRFRAHRSGRQLAAAELAAVQAGVALRAAEADLVEARRGHALEILRMTAQVIVADALQTRLAEHRQRLAHRVDTHVALATGTLHARLTRDRQRHARVRRDGAVVVGLARLRSVVEVAALVHRPRRLAGAHAVAIGIDAREIGRAQADALAEIAALAWSRNTHRAVAEVIGRARVAERADRQLTDLDAGITVTAVTRHDLARERGVRDFGRLLGIGDLALAGDLERVLHASDAVRIPAQAVELGLRDPDLERRHDAVRALLHAPELRRERLFRVALAREVGLADRPCQRARELVTVDRLAALLLAARQAQHRRQSDPRTYVFHPVSPILPESLDGGY